MPATWVYPGSTLINWQEVATWWAYDGTHETTGWRDIQEAWVYDSAWRKVFEAVSCLTATCVSEIESWGAVGGRFCAACGANTCSYCMRLNWTNCTDVCHNIDGYVSVNFGSFLLSTNCANKSCTFDGGCNCSAGGSYEFSCEISKSCVTDDDSYRGQLKIQRDSDSVNECTLTGNSRTGVCAM